MTIALIGHIEGSSAAGNTFTTSTLDTTGANLLVATCSDYTLTTAAVLTDSNGNTWTPRTAYATTSGTRSRIIYSVPTTVGSGHTFTFTGTTIYGAISVMAFSGAHATPYDTESGAFSDVATTLATGSITPSENNCVVVTALGERSGGAATVDGGFATPYLVAFAGGQHWGMGGSYLIQTTAAAANPAWSWTGANSASAAVASFKAAAVAGSVIPVFMNQYRQRRA